MIFARIMNFSKFIKFFIVFFAHFELFFLNLSISLDFDINLKKFYELVDVSGDYDAFHEILLSMVENPVGKSLVKSINELLSDKKYKIHNRYKLNVQEIVDPSKLLEMNFVPTIGDDLPTIRFTRLPVNLTVIDIKNIDYQKTKLQNTEPDVILFHEMLHWAHFLLNKDRMLNDICLGNSLMKTKNATFFSNQIFNDFPLLKIITSSNNIEAIMMYSIHHNQWNLDKYISKHILEECGGWEKTLKPKFIINNVYIDSFFVQNVLSDVLFNDDKIYVIKIEEVRTIIGSGDLSTHLLDQISENAYRLAKAEKSPDNNEILLRYGHGITPCVLSAEMINWIISRAKLGFESAAKFISSFEGE